MNQDIRNAARVAGIPLWKIGKAFGGYSDSYFSKLLRDEFSQEQKEKIFGIIEELKSQEA